MASVYLAQDERLERQAAVKMPKASHLNAEFAERFAREAKWHAKVENLHVVHILDRGEEAGTPFLVLQYLPGGNLKAWCQRNPSILSDLRLHYESWLLPIAEALDAVAAKGIVHRDVKPTNILFDADGKGYLSDFGIVKAGAEATMTGTGLFIGTLQFMSPEQCQPEAKRALDGRSDQYGLGVTVYQVLTGWKYPVEDDTAVIYAAKFGHVPMTEPRTHAPLVPQAVNDAVMRAMSPDRERRFGSCVEFVRAVFQGFATSTTGATVPLAVAVTPLAAVVPRVAMTGAKGPAALEGTPDARPAGPGPARTGRPWWLVAAACAVIAGSAGYLAWQGREQGRPPQTAPPLQTVEAGPQQPDRDPPEAPRAEGAPAPARRQEVEGEVTPVAALAAEAWRLIDAAKYAEAEPLLEQALAIREKTQGPDHPDTAACLYDLGWLHVSRARDAEAEPLIRRALAIQEKALGPDHPTTAKSLRSLGWLSIAEGRAAEAEPLIQRALAICEQCLGRDHPETAKSLYFFAVLYLHRGDAAAAEPLVTRALETFEKALGPDDPRTRDTRATLLALQGEREQAADAP